MLWRGHGLHTIAHAVEARAWDEHKGVQGCVYASVCRTQGVPEFPGVGGRNKFRTLDEIANVSIFSLDEKWRFSRSLTDTAVADCTMDTEL